MTAEEKPFTYPGLYLPEDLKKKYDKAIQYVASDITREIPDWVITVLMSEKYTHLDELEEIVIDYFNKGILTVIRTESELIPIIDAVTSAQVVSAKVVSDVYIEKSESFAEKIVKWTGGFWGGLITDFMLPQLESLRKDGFMSEEMYLEWKDRLSEKKFTPAVLSILVYVMTAFISITVFTEANAKKTIRAMNKKFHPDIPGFQDFLKESLWNENSEEYVIDLMEQAGLDRKHFDHYTEAVKQRFNLAEVLSLHWRKKLDTGEFDDLLKKAGYTGREEELAKVFEEAIPAIQDVIRFAVRDVFNPKVVEEFGLMEEYPELLTEFAAKWGYDEKTAKYFWGSHWQMPPPFSVYQMMHRGLIDETGADTLLRIADWPKPIRKLLLGISYQTLSRVDVRRMHAMGKLDRAGVVKAMRDNGYSPFNAELYADFVEAYNFPDELKLSKAQLLTAYKDRIFTKQETIDVLGELGYKRAEAEFLILLEDYKANKKLVTERIKLIEKLYTIGEYDEIQVKGKLGEQGVTGEKMNSLLETWDLRKKARMKTVGDDTLKQWFKKQLITEIEFREGLRKNGWSEDLIPIIIKDTVMPDIK